MSHQSLCTVLLSARVHSDSHRHRSGQETGQLVLALQGFPSVFAELQGFIIKSKDDLLSCSIPCSPPYFASKSVFKRGVKREKIMNTGHF